MTRSPLLITLLLVCASPLTAMSTSAHIVDSSPSGFTVENSAVVPVNPALTWAVLVHDVDSWWPKNHSWWGKDSKFTIDARAGGCFCEIAGDRQAQHLQVVLVNPPTLLRMAGGLGPTQGMGLSGVLEWRLQPVDGGTRITLWYRAGGYTPDDLRTFAATVDRVQALQLGGLAKWVNEQSAKPASDQHPP